MNGEKYFNETTFKINEILATINKTEREINKLVYKLYLLTNQEIEIIENNVII